MNKDELIKVIQRQNELIEGYQTRIARSTGKLTYYIENRRSIPSDAMKDIRDLLKGIN